jgi:hypothetical protein
LEDQNRPERRIGGDHGPVTAEGRFRAAPFATVVNAARYTTDGLQLNTSATPDA